MKSSLQNALAVFISLILSAPIFADSPELTESPELAKSLESGATVQKTFYLSSLFKEGASSGSFTPNKILTSYEKTLKDWLSHSLTLEGRMTEPLNLNSEILSSQAEKTLQVDLSKTFRLGINKAAIEKRLQAEVDTRKFSLQAQLTEQKSEIAALYCAAVYQEELAHHAISLKAELEPLLKVAEQAVDRGSAQSLTYIKWNMIYQRISQQSRLSQHKANLIRTEVQHLTGIKIPETASLTYLPDPIDLAVFEKFDGSSIPSLAAVRQEAESMKMLVNEQQSWQIEAGIGVEKELDQNEPNSYLLKLSIPIEQGFLNADKRRRALAASKLSQEEYQLEQLKTEQTIRLRLMKLRMLMEDWQSAQSTFQQTADLHAKTMRAFRTGIAEFAEVIETLEAKYASQVSLVEKHYEFMSNLALARIMIGDL